MFAFMDNMKGLELLFACCAIFGATLFMIRLILMFAGFGDSHGSIDGSGADAGHAGAMDHGGDYHDSDLSFKTLSLQGITAFFMMFGLIGWAMERKGGYDAWVPILCGTIAGIVTVWMMKKIFQLASGLQSSGTMDIHNAIGQEGTVYLTIHAGDTGKVQVTVQDRLSVLDAVAESKQDIKTGEPVRVVRVSSGKLVVEKIG